MDEASEGGPRLTFESSITVLSDSRLPKLEIQEVSATAFMHGNVGDILGQYEGY